MGSAHRRSLEGTPAPNYRLSVGATIKEEEPSPTESPPRAIDAVSDTRDLLRFLPSVLVEQIRSHRGTRWREGKEPISAAFVFVDVFGLHRLTDALPLREAESSVKEQRRSKLLQATVRCFDRLASVARAHGGDVVKFTGDGLLIVWPFPRIGPQRSAEARVAVVSASRCALALLRAHNSVLWSDSEEPAGLAEEGGGSGGGAAGDGASRMTAVVKLAKLRSFSADSSGFDTLNQGGLILLPGELEDRVLDIVGMGADKQLPPKSLRLSLAAGIGVGDLFSMHVGSAQRWEYVVWGEPLAEMIRSVQEHARPNDALASQDVLSLAPDALVTLPCHFPRHAPVTLMGPSPRPIRCRARRSLTRAPLAHARALVCDRRCFRPIRTTRSPTRCCCCGPSTRPPTASTPSSSRAPRPVRASGPGSAKKSPPPSSAARAPRRRSRE